MTGIPSRTFDDSEHDASLLPQSKTENKKTNNLQIYPNISQFRVKTKRVPIVK